MPGESGPAAAGQQPEPVVEAVRELLGGHRAEPDGGQLDRERHPVERGADAGQRPVVGEVLVPRRRPVAQQLDGLGARERLDRPQRLAGDSQRFPARREDPQSAALAEQAVRESGRGLDDVLAVVEHQQRFAVADRGDQPVHRIRGGRFAEQRVAEAEPGQRGLRDVVPAPDGGEFDQPGAVVQVADQRAGGFRRQPGLSRSAGPGEGGEPMPRHQVADRGYVGFFPDVAGELGAQIGLAAFLAPPHLAAQQRDVQRGQFGRGVGAQFVGQCFPDALERLQRLGVAARGGERAHQRGDEPLPHRVRGHQVGQFRDEIRAAAEVELGFEPILHRRQPQGFQPRGRRVERVAVLQADVLHRRTAPQLQCLAQSPGPVVPGLGG